MAKVNLTLDIREVTNYPELPELAEAHDDVESYSIQMLEIGDLIVDNNVIIEHKTPNDFVESMKSGHLEDQIERMWMGYDHVHVFVSGDMRDFMADHGGGVVSGGYMAQHRSWGDKNQLEKSIKGFIGSLSIRWDVTPLFCSDLETVVEEAVIHGRKAVEPPSRKPAGPQVSLKRDMSPVEAALMLVDGISTTIAERFEEHERFNTVGEICEADPEELTEIDGVGGTTAEEIKKVLQ